MIVPGLGAVLAHGQAPYYSEEDGRWLAPRRVFSFNPELQRTDGLLAASVARRNEISIEAAGKLVAEESARLADTLRGEGHVSLGAVGSLSRDEDGYLSFTAGDPAWLSPSYMWLPDVNIVPLAHASMLDRYNRAKQARKQLPNLLMRIGKVAASIALLVALGWIAVQNLTYAPEEQYASVAPTQFAAKPTVAVDDSKPVVLVLAQAPKDESVENLKPQTAPSPKAIVAAPFVADASYYLIVASLANQAEADKYVRENTDKHLGILAKDGRYRVYAASGNSWDELSALSQTDDFASRYPNAWICRP